jgi:hemin uptake protein HemP
MEDLQHIQHANQDQLKAETSSRLQTRQLAPAAKDAAMAGSSAAESNNTIESKTLLGSSGQLIILHNGERYLLRRTKQGKLILTK